MATKKTVSKISDKLISVNDNFTVYMYDNGYMFEISGKDSTDEWPSAKILCNTVEDLITLIKEAAEMDRT